MRRFVLAVALGALAPLAAAGCAVAGGDASDAGLGPTADAPSLGREPDADPMEPDAAPRPDAPPQPDAAPPPPIDAAPPPPADAAAGTPDAMVGMPDACVPGWTNLLVNPNFDVGVSPWVESSSGGFPIIGAPPTGLTANTAPNVAWLGGYTDGTDTITQSGIVVPANAMALRLRGVFVIGTEEPDTTPFDFVRFQVGGAVIGEFSNANAAGAFAPFEFASPSPLAGQTITITISATNDILFSTGFIVDSLALEVLACPP